MRKKYNAIAQSFTKNDRPTTHQKTRSPNHPLKTRSPHHSPENTIAQSPTQNAIAHSPPPKRDRPIPHKTRSPNLSQKK
ncbi:hypothetical protein VB775_02025 [Pseudanabaena sp. CCNP1317]|nr:hypothetical protein [Pseudanabaena sp. CCNP1317]